MAGLNDFFLGTQPSIQQVNRFNPDQQNALSGLLQQGQQGLKNPTQGFQPIADQARTQFNQSTIPSLAERFTSFGGGNNALSSPAFAGQLGQAGSGLEGLLASLQAQYGQQQQSHFSNLLGMGLQPQQDNLQAQGEPGAIQNFLPTLMRILGHAGGAALTGGASVIPSALAEILQMLASSGLKGDQ